MGSTQDPSIEWDTLSARSVHHAINDRSTIRKRHQSTRLAPLPRPSPSRLESSLKERPCCISCFVKEAHSNPKGETVLYLAYGSNLQAAKFRGDRGIKPLSRINVQVPSLRMTFDLPGIPYAEPCFANTARRDPKDDPPRAPPTFDEKTALLGVGTQKEYKKNGWHKSLIGVVYEVTPEDYAHIIATEGGGSGYQDILVDCHPFVSSDPNEPVPETPSLPAFKAHTLFAPAVPDGDKPPQNGGHLQRPDPAYAQASARYLKIIVDGAAECELPYEYQKYLRSLQSYTITTTKQRLGQFVFLSMWLPIVMFIFAIGKFFVDENGQLPQWLKQLTSSVFWAVWGSYDSFFKPLFGDGERTVEKESRGGTEGKHGRSRQEEKDIEKGIP